MCEEMFLFKTALQTQLSIYADKNHVILISDRFSYERKISFLHKIKRLSGCELNSFCGANVFIVLRCTREI